MTKGCSEEKQREEQVNLLKNPFSVQTGVPLLIESIKPFALVKAKKEQKGFQNKETQSFSSFFLSIIIACTHAGNG